MTDEEPEPQDPEMDLKELANYYVVCDELRKRNSPAYQILEFIRDNYKNELDLLEEFIEETFPAEWEQFKSDNYDGPDKNRI